MGVEKLIDGEVPNVMKNRGEEGKIKGSRKERSGGNTIQIYVFFPIPVFCHMSLGNQILIKEFKCNSGTSSTFIH